MHTFSCVPIVCACQESPSSFYPAIVLSVSLHVIFFKYSPSTDLWPSKRKSRTRPRRGSSEKFKGCPTVRRGQIVSLPICKVQSNYRAEVQVTSVVGRRGVLVAMMKNWRALSLTPKWPWHRPVWATVTGETRVFRPLTFVSPFESRKTLKIRRT